MAGTESSLASLGSLEVPTSRSDLVAERIRKAILAGQIPPGTALVERDLAAQLGVSKTPVREALISLSRSGLLTVNRHRGMTVSTVDEDVITSISELRVLLEPYAVRKAVAKWRRDDSIRARDLLRQANAAARKRDLPQVSIINREFHHLLYSRGTSELLCSILDNLQDRVALIGMQSWHERPTWQREGEEHAAILEAIEGGRAEAAAELSLQHVNLFTELIGRLRLAHGGGPPE